MKLPLADGFLVPRFRPLLSDDGRQAVRTSLLLAVAGGIIQGCALLVLLPGASSLATGAVAWGLPFGGWLLVLAVLAVLGAGIEYVLALAGYRSALDFVDVVHQRVGDMIARIPLGWFKEDSAGRFSRMVSKEMLNLGQTLAHMVYPLTANAAALLVVLVGSWVWDRQLGLALTIAVPVLYAFLAVARWCLDRGRRPAEPTEVELAARVVEFATRQGALRSCGQGARFRELTTARADNARVNRRGLWWGLLANVIPGMWSQAVVVALVVIAAGLATAGRLGPIEAIAFIGLSLRFLAVLSSIQDGVIGIEDRRLLMNQMDEIVHAPVLPEPAHGAAQAQPGSVELERVSFSYEPGVPVLRDVSLAVPPRTVCALVGPSGCGKTTVARLIARFYDVDSGVVRVGGADVRDLTTADLMGGLSMVFQDVYLFDDTLEANIRVGRPDASVADVRRAAALAGVEEIVARLPQGYATPVGEGGRALSGGERQRVSVARALLKQAPVVLFDEATSALDAENEANIVASMQELRATSTLLVIAHKLDTIMSADQVVVLAADGTVAQVGTHDELIGLDGPYRRFWEKRAGAAGWALVRAEE